MSIVNFSIPKTLGGRIKEIMEQKGFASKAEFFRFAAIYFLDIIDKPIISEDERFNSLTEAIQKEVTEAYGGKKLPSLEQQLSDI